uniref:Uncharacterized protein n=1 Tax=Nelumbo nucifera TaxID=4432 RepID=A0A822YMT0_NELNU|nr:TPA_asm: hypothetical protein HUJ06_012771 [Nelumbo nucifera]
MVMLIPGLARALMIDAVPPDFSDLCGLEQFFRRRWWGKVVGDLPIIHIDKWQGVCTGRRLFQRRDSNLIIRSSRKPGAEYQNFSRYTEPKPFKPFLERGHDVRRP